jgi:hypothetical protein
MPRYEADAVRSARLKGKKMAVEIKDTNRENVQVNILEKTLVIAENKIIMKASPFFYE